MIQAATWMRWGLGLREAGGTVFGRTGCWNFRDTRAGEDCLEALQGPLLEFPDWDLAVSGSAGLLGTIGGRVGPRSRGRLGPSDGIGLRGLVASGGPSGLFALRRSPCWGACSHLLASGDPVGYSSTRSENCVGCFGYGITPISGLSVVQAAGIGYGLASQSTVPEGAFRLMAGVRVNRLSREGRTNACR